MTTSLLHPKGGVRVLLERAAVDDTGADYRAALYLPAERFDYRVHIAADGAITLAPALHSPEGRGVPAGAGATTREAEARLVELLRQMAKRTWRDAKGTPMRWPERVLVWRPLDGDEPSS